jgi:hypothetical protein
MLDYLDEDCGFVVRSYREWCNWPEDLRLMLRTRRHRPEWESLCAAFVASRALRLSDSPAYWRMSQRARERLRGHCSRGAAAAELRQFVRTQARGTPGPGPLSRLRDAAFASLLPLWSRGARR